MKIRIKPTGKIAEINQIQIEDNFVKTTDIEVLHEIDWEQRRFELVKAAMQGLLSTCSPGLLDKNLLAALSIDYADTVLAEYRKEVNNNV